MELTRLLEIEETERVDALQIQESESAPDILALTDTSIAPNGIVPLPGSQPLPYSAALVPPIPSTARSQSVPLAIDAPPPIPRKPVWQAHDIDVDVLHYKLIRHKYHTPADFLHDVALIEDNSTHLGDAERGAKIGELAANARLHVGTFDERWLPEFERYKGRMLERKEKRRLEKGKEKVTELHLLEDGGAEMNGVSGVVLEDSLKRLRDDQPEDIDDRAGKRIREGEMDIDVADIVVSQTHSTLLTPASTPAIPQISVPAPQPAPPPAYPPFILPENSTRSLEVQLGSETAGLNVEELEQLRAGLYERVWRGRALWDRRGVVDELKSWVTGFLREVVSRKAT